MMSSDTQYRDEVGKRRCDVYYLLVGKKINFVKCVGLLVISLHKLYYK